MLTVKKEFLDWIALIQAAKKIGLSQAEIKDYLKMQQQGMKKP